MSAPAPHAGVLKSIDQDLPDSTPGNLADFQKVYSDLAAYHCLLEEDFGPHTKFALTGCCTNEDDEKLRMKIQPQDGEIQSFRTSQYDDVDSVIGFVHRGETFPLQPDNTLFYTMFNNTGMTLDSSLHLPPMEFVQEDGAKVVSTFILTVWMPTNYFLFLTLEPTLPYDPKCSLWALGWSQCPEDPCALFLPRSGCQTGGTPWEYSQHCSHEDLL